MSSNLINKLLEALEHAHGEYDLQSLMAKVHAGDAQLWHEGDAVIVTEVLDFPRTRVLHFWLGAGSLEDVITLQRKVNAWGKEQGCARATLHGRKGWVKALRADDWVEEGVIMGKVL